MTGNYHCCPGRVKRIRSAIGCRHHWLDGLGAYAHGLNRVGLCGGLPGEIEDGRWEKQRCGMRPPAARRRRNDDDDGDCKPVPASKIAGEACRSDPGRLGQVVKI
jgi:hypothetical protein